MSTLIHLVRHGETTWNAEQRIQGQSESQLSPNGIEQAKQIGKSPLLQNFSQVFSSDLRRTRETTSYLLNGKTVDVIYDSTLREIFLGPWEGMLYAEVAETAPADLEHFLSSPSNFNLAGAETFHQLQQRGLKAINAIAEQCRGQEVLVISHGALLKSVLTFYAQRALGDLWVDPKMHNCAHSIIEFDADQNGKILRFCDCETW